MLKGKLQVFGVRNLAIAWFLVGVFGVGQLTFAAASAAPNLNPSQLVAQGVEDLTQVFARHEATFAIAPADFYADLNSTLEPYVDFRYISARVMGGRYFNAATPEQRRKFATTFQTGLVQTLGQGLMSFGYQEFALNLVERASRYEDQDTIDLEVVTHTGERFPVSFTLRLHNQEWKIINVIVNGVNLGLTFNSQFDRAMRDSNRNFDRVIAEWSVSETLEDLSRSEDERRELSN